MVSSSQSHRLGHKLTPENKLAQQNLRDTIRICKGPKPLAKTSFYLDVNNHGLSVKIESKLKELGAKIEVFLDKTVRLVVSDRTGKTDEKSKNDLKWDCISGGGSGGPPSLSSIQVPTPVLTPSTPYLGNESPLSNSTNIRGQTTQRHKSRVDAMLERALTQPQHCSVDPLSKARDWAIPIWPTDKLLAWLDKIYKSINKYKHQQSNRNHAAKRFSSPRVTHLKKPYIKFEPYTRDKKPAYLELPVWPRLNFDGEPGSCPFIKKNPVEEIKKENRENAHLANKQKEKEMTRRPRATATRARKSELVSGYCEICRIDYKDLSKHVQSEQHLKFVQNNDNFLSLDKLIHTGASVQAFLKLNQTKHVHKDCKLFSNGDRDVITDKNKKASKADLSFTVAEEIEMVQCNGTRRELNLNSLTSAHNLRTRAKHESGHMLRSKGRSWEPEDCPNDKSYNNLEGFIITKRAEGTIWLEEEDDDARDSKSCNDRQDNCSKFVLNDLDKPEESNDENEPKENAINSCNNQVELKSGAEGENKRLADGTANRTKINGYVDASSKEGLKNDKSDQLANGDVESANCNGVANRNGTKSTKSNCSDRGRNRGRRGNRSMIRSRPRLSVEERLIADNRAYYKVEVLGNKLRSSAIPNATATESVVSTTLKQLKKENEDEVEQVKGEELVDGQPSSEKPVVVRLRRVRKSELSLLSDEAESFMFREPKSGATEDDCSSVLPKDTESDPQDTKNSTCISSSESDKIGNKSEGTDDDSQDSLSLGRARKKRRTQAEALIKDNEDYYKFETPGSRLRYQAPIGGVKDAGMDQNVDATMLNEEQSVANENLSTNPSARIEKMHFSFESVPKSEPWYQTYQRQDEGAEYWHYFSESDVRPFLLPYEIENFREIYLKNLPRLENIGARRGRGRGRGRGKVVGSTHIGRSPRKSPRCHASTLAIMSTIIRKKEQQPDSALPVIKEEPMPCTLEQDKSDIENELREMRDILIGKNDDDLDLDLEIADPVADSFEVADALQPKGAPLNLLELLDNCHAQIPILENEQSGASSECGEIVGGPWSELPLRRREKKRKNKTGWPGNRMRRKYSLEQTDEKLTDDVEPQILLEQLQTDKLEQKERNSRLKSEKTTETTQTPTGAMSTNKEHDNFNLSRSEESNEKKPSEEKALLQRHECDYADEARESSPVNDENHHENVENRKRKRQRTSTSCDDVADSYHETENEYSSNYEDAKRQNSSVGTRKRSQFSRKRCRQRATKRPRKRVKTAADLELENECNKAEFCENSLTINNSSPRKGGRRSKEDSESELKERITPTVLTPTELVQKRSSIEFQPVVRVMKIDERVDIEHSIRSVAVASNRRLRSSASVKSNLPTSRRKRHRNNRSQLQPRRWMKNS